MGARVKWVAELAHVREVTVVGAADLAYWQRFGAIRKDGRAEVRIIAADAVFRGIRFQEVSVSVTMAADAAYLVAAYNSRRFFAWSERVFFSTPYRYAPVRLTAERPADVLSPALIAKMNAPREAARAVHDEWNGTVHLPSGKLFHARIAGAVERYPFDAADAWLVLLPELRESHFEPREWWLRADASHAKSKTYRSSSRAAR